MAYFTEEFTSFFKELDSNNQKEWFHANKKRYEAHVKKPLYQLVDDVVAKVQEYDPNLNLEAKNAVFRINRDIRFSKDKTPYKTHVAAIISNGGRKDKISPGIYFHVEADRMTLGSGCHMPDKNRLNKIRQAIINDNKSLHKVLNSKAFKSTFGEMQGDKYKVLPAEYKEAAAGEPLLFNKSFHFMADYKGAKYVQAEDLDDFIVQHYLTAKPWNEWLLEACS